MTTRKRERARRRLRPANPFAAIERLGVLVGALLALPACREPAPGSNKTEVPPLDGSPARESPDARFEEFVKQYLDGRTAFAPATATWLGLHGADDKLDDVSVAAATRELTRLRRAFDRLETFPASTLDPDHQLDRALLDRDARYQLYELAEVRPQERSPIHYIDLFQSGLYELLARDFAPLPDRLHDGNGRLSRARNLFDEARRNLKNPPDLLTRRAIDLVAQARGFVAETLPRLYQAASQASGDDRLLADFRTAQAEALRALDDYAGFLTRDLQPRSKGDLALGKARLIERVRLRELSDLPPDVLYAQFSAAADRELKLAAKRFEEAAQRAFPGRSPADAYRALEDDHPTADTLLSTVQATLDALTRFVGQKRALVPPPSPAHVVEMPPYVWGFVRMALPGPFEPEPQTALYVDPVNPAWDKKTAEEHLRAFHRAQLSQTLAREAIAHAAQAEAARRAPTTMQKLTVDEAFAEGWPRYFAQELLDEGFGADAEGRPDPRLRLAQRREALIAVCRFTAVLRFHAGGARIDDVVNLFGNSCYLEDTAARREAERVAVDPDVLDEGLGYLAIAKLAADVAREQGAAFSPARFHEELLAHGQMPLGLLRRRLLKSPDENLL